VRERERSRVSEMESRREREREKEKKKGKEVFQLERLLRWRNGEILGRMVVD
jgi:hypothetical protein